MELLEKKSYDLILLDLSLPGCQGVEALVQLRNEVPETALVAMSAKVDAELAGNIIRAGAQELLVKNKRSKRPLMPVLLAAVERQQMMARLKGYDRLKFELLYTASHELRTPLTLIRANTEMVARHPERRGVASRR